MDCVCVVVEVNLADWSQIAQNLVLLPDWTGLDWARRQDRSGQVLRVLNIVYLAQVEQQVRRNEFPNFQCLNMIVCY